jgi:hypothetical protein
MRHSIPLSTLAGKPLEKNSRRRKKPLAPPPLLLNRLKNYIFIPFSRLLTRVARMKALPYM